jgi:SAM-dependent methyltransferase
MANEYSERWFRTFLETYSAERTSAEINLIEMWLPRPDFLKLLDVCCGEGRHSAVLAQRGYATTGIDVNHAALEKARLRSAGRVTYVHADMRDLGAVSDTFDAAVNMWASFGNFDDASNKHVLRGIRAKLRSGGRFILDVYDPEFFENHQGQREQVVGGKVVATETKSIVGDRLRTRLEYVKGGSDVFEWRLYRPQELEKLMSTVGFSSLKKCSNFDETIVPRGEFPRMQFLFQRN